MHGLGFYLAIRLLAALRTNAKAPEPKPEPPKKNRPLSGLNLRSYLEAESAHGFSRRVGSERTSSSNP